MKAQFLEIVGKAFNQGRRDFMARVLYFQKQKSIMVFIGITRTGNVRENFFDQKRGPVLAVEIGYGKNFLAFMKVNNLAFGSVGIFDS